MAGVALLMLGVILRFTGVPASIFLVCMVSGILLKIYCIVILTRKNLYKPGPEMLLLLLGLTLFFSSMVMKQLGIAPYFYFMITGLTLKLVFVILFIRKTATVKSQ